MGIITEEQYERARRKVMRKRLNQKLDEALASLFYQLLHRRSPH